MGDPQTPQVVVNELRAPHARPVYERPVIAEIGRVTRFTLTKSCQTDDFRFARCGDDD